jgi:hypothetical protein
MLALRTFIVLGCLVGLISSGSRMPLLPGRTKHRRPPRRPQRCTRKARISAAVYSLEPDAAFDDLPHLPSNLDSSTGDSSEWADPDIASWVQSIAPNTNLAYWDLPEEQRATEAYRVTDPAPRRLQGFDRRLPFG